MLGLRQRAQTVTNSRIEDIHEQQAAHGIVDIEYARSTVVSRGTIGSHEVSTAQVFDSMLDTVHLKNQKENIFSAPSNILALFCSVQTQVTSDH
jgi:hypothetical protein